MPCELAHGFHHYEVESPEHCMHPGSVFGDNPEPPEYGRAWGIFAAESPAKAKALAIKAPDFQEWVDGNSPGSPFKGLTVRLFGEVCPHGVCWGCEEEGCDDCIAEYAKGVDGNYLWLQRELLEVPTMTDYPPALIEFNPQSRRNDNPWARTDDPLWLLTPAEFALLPDGMTVVSIHGESKVVGRDYIDQDTRFGMLAWGFHDSQLPPYREGDDNR